MSALSPRHCRMPNVCGRNIDSDYNAYAFCPLFHLNTKFWTVTETSFCLTTASCQHFLGSRRCLAQIQRSNAALLALATSISMAKALYVTRYQLITNLSNPRKLEDIATQLRAQLALGCYFQRYKYRLMDCKTRACPASVSKTSETLSPLSALSWNRNSWFTGKPGKLLIKTKWKGEPN